MKLSCIQINYASAHDNETLFDIIMLKVARDVSLEERLRLNHLATSIIALSQVRPKQNEGIKKRCVWQV
jgi:pullulanase/glycogen debranching enzyme